MRNLDIPLHELAFVAVTRGMLGAGVGGWHVVRTGVSGTGMEHPRDAPLLGGRTHRQSGGRFLKAGQRPVT